MQEAVAAMAVSPPAEAAGSTDDAGGRLVLHFNITNTHHAPLRIGGLGMAMPSAGHAPHSIESSANGMRSGVG